MAIGLLLLTSVVVIVAGARARYKGSGSINGPGDFGFILTAIDGQLPGGGSIVIQKG